MTLEVPSSMARSKGHYMTSFMVHFDIKTKYVRYQGGWKKASEAMPDLYLREAKTVVLKSQVQVLDLLRRVLEGKSLDYKTFEFPFQKVGRSTRVDFGRRTPS